MNEQVRLQDLYPTILEAAGIPVPTACGKDATSLAEEPLRARTVVSEFGPMVISLKETRAEFPGEPAEFFNRLASGYVAVREPTSVPGARKYVSVFRPGEGGSRTPIREELFDLAADPGEIRNLLPAERAAADRLRAVGEAGR